MNKSALLLSCLLTTLLAGCPAPDDDDAGDDDIGDDDTGDDDTGDDDAGDDDAGDDDAGDDDAGDDDAGDDDSSGPGYPWEYADGAPTPIQCGAPPPPNDTLCTVTPGGDDLLVTGQILGEDEVFLGGQVLIQDGLIACVGCDCTPGAADPTLLDCPWAAVSPGLINAHDHISFIQNTPQGHGDERYEHRHDWRRGRNGHTEINAGGSASGDERAWGELRFVLGGATSILGSGNSDGLLRNLDADQEGLGEGSVEYQTFPLGDSSGATRDFGCDYPSFDSFSVLDADAYTPHIAEGIDRAARNELLCLSSPEGGGRDLTEENTAIIHAVGIHAAEAAMLAAEGSSVIWSPRSNVDLYGNTAPVTLLDSLGVNLALGTDWTPSGSMNVLRELACADHLNTEHYGGWFGDWQLWGFATAGAARATAVDDATGALAPGLEADLALFDARLHPGRPFRAVLEADPGTVALTLRGGEILAGTATLVDALPGGDGCEELPMSVCGQAVRACLQRELDTDFTTLAAANSGSYDLFFCDTPQDEPSCDPFRADEYDGPTPTDQDGDGVEDTDDNCPAVFNPVRPMDLQSQPDADGDGLGDVCDPCPIGEAPGGACVTFDPADRDGDGHDNAFDNCPGDANAGQADGDMDGVGDVCDACPLDLNLPDGSCPADVQDIKMGLLADGLRVTVEDLVVTAVNDVGWFAQLPSPDPFLGNDFGGVWTYAGAAPKPAVGDLATWSGTVSDWFGQWQLGNPANLAVSANDQPIPAPEAVEYTEVDTGGDRSEALEGVLVSVAPATMTLRDPPAGPGDQDPTGEFVVGTLRVNDFLSTAWAYPFPGDEVAVTGVLRFANGDSKVEPRGADDVVVVSAAPPSLVLVAPQTAYAWLGASDEPPAEPVVATLDRTAPAGGVELTVSSADPGILDVTTPLVVPQGEYGVELRVTAPALGSTTVTIGLGSQSVDVDFTVLDPDALPSLLQVDPSILTVLLGQTVPVVVLLETPAPPGGVTIGVESADGIVDHDDTVLVQGGEIGGFLAIEGARLGTADVRLTLGADELLLPVEVTDVPSVGLVISEVLYDVSGGDDGQEWVELYNGTASAVDLSTWSLGSGGASWTYSTAPLSGSIPAGACQVFGGPIATADNGNPSFDLVVNFDPDLQNSGSTADGVALFDVPESQIAGAVPVDAVLYGGFNGSGLVDETGAPGDVDSADAPANTSVTRGAGGWFVQPPTPGDCSHVFP